MPMNFPDSPAVNAIYSSAGMSWIWTGTAWKAYSVPGAGATISDTPPATTVNGNLWWNSSPGDGQLYLWYTDPSGSQWVVANNLGAGIYLPLTGGTVTGGLTVADPAVSVGNGLFTVTGVLANQIDYAPFQVSAPATSDLFYRLKGNHDWGIGVKGSASGAGLAGQLFISDYTAGTGRLSIDTTGYVNFKNAPGQIQLYHSQAGTVPAHGPTGMQGFGYRFTPQSSTRVLIILSGSIVIDTVNATVGAELRYGTGTSPAYGAAAAGTSVNHMQCTLTNAILQIPCTLHGIATGLTVGTNYWFDVYMTYSSGQGDFFTTNITFLEV